MADDNQPRSQSMTPLNKAIEKITKPAFKKHGLAEVRLITEWHHIAGSVLAKKSLPVRLVFPKNKREGGTLHLRVASGWAPEVQHLEPIILSKIATYFGYRAVGKLFIQQGPLPKQEKAKPPPLQRTLSPEDAATINHVTQHIDDADLKKALQALGSTILSKRPGC